MKANSLWRVPALLALVTVPLQSGYAQHGMLNGEWRHWGGDSGNTKYSSLDQINAGNFKDLKLAWAWDANEVIEPVTSENSRVRPGQFKATPLMVRGVLYLPTAIAQVVAVDAATGKLIWSYDPVSYEAGRPANVGFQHRGVEYWEKGDDRRIFIATHDRRLIALNADTGKPVESFGQNGQVDLVPSLGRAIDVAHLTHSSPPAVCRDTVVVGSIVHDMPRAPEAPPGHVRGFDAVTGELKWVFHTIPQRGEFGVETWENDSWKYSGATNVWSMFAADEELGYVYMPISTPTNDMYGGHRLGDNLFAESVVCVNADTGERVWHFQAVHHGLWDYDFPTAPTLMDITVGGKKIKAVAQVSKQAFTYVFDRVTGEPVWPIEERPVPPSTVPGERASPTQPFPTKPPAYDRQGLTEDDIIDFTPEIRARAMEAISGLQLAPMFTPPVVDGEGKPVIVMPGPGGGSNWPGAAYDPELNYLLVPSVTSPMAFTLIQPRRSEFTYIIKSWMGVLPGLGGLPLTKPPWARVTAINMNEGDHAWMTPHGEGPRNHPDLAGLDLPPLGAPAEGLGGGGPLVTKTLLFAGKTAGGSRDYPTEGPKLHVFDKVTGESLGGLELPDNPYGNPITYEVNGKQYICVATGGGGFMGGGGTAPMLLAYTLP